jgi:hypothetical protein
MKHLSDKIDWPQIDFVIETGTHHGGTTRFLHSLGKRVYTVELSEELFREYSPPLVELEIVCINKDSVNGIKEILASEPSGKYLLFLDAHGSGGDTTFDPRVGRFGSPILSEIETCRKNPPEIIVVDDYNDCIKLDTYPSPEEIKKLILELGDYEFEELTEYNGNLIARKK